MQCVSVSGLDTGFPNATCKRKLRSNPTVARLLCRMRYTVVCSSPRDWEKPALLNRWSAPPIDCEGRSNRLRTTMFIVSLQLMVY